MTGRVSHRRNWKAWLVACLLAVFVSVPLLDQMACQAEGPAAASSTSISTAALDVDHAKASANHADASANPADDGGGLGVCLHGHCHHSQTATTRTVVEVAHLAPSVIAHLATNTSVLHSADADHLKRPPRA